VEEVCPIGRETQIRGGLNAVCLAGLSSYAQAQQGRGRDLEQGMDLSNRPIDSPAGALLSPMEHKLLGRIFGAGIVHSCPPDKEKASGIGLPVWAIVESQHALELDKVPRWLGFGIDVVQLRSGIGSRSGLV